MEKEMIKMYNLDSIKSEKATKILKQMQFYIDENP